MFRTCQRRNLEGIRRRGSGKVRILVPGRRSARLWVSEDRLTGSAGDGYRSFARLPPGQVCSLVFDPLNMLGSEAAIAPRGLAPLLITLLQVSIPANTLRA